MSIRPQPQARAAINGLTFVKEDDAGCVGEPTVENYDGGVGTTPKCKNRACSARFCHFTHGFLRVRYAAKATAPVRET